MKAKIKKESDKLYIIMTIMAVLAFGAYNYFLVVDYYLVLLISLACIVCIGVLWLIAFYAAKRKLI